MKKLEEYLECAVIVSTHGVRGTVRLENRCDSPEVLASLKTLYFKNDGGFSPLYVEKASVQKNMVLAEIKGIDSVEAAQAMRSTVLYAARRDFNLSDGSHFIADLVGLPVLDAETGEKYGVLENVIAPGAQQIYVVRDRGESFMIPAVPEFIREISLGGDNDEKDEGIYVKLIDGMRQSGV